LEVIGGSGSRASSARVMQAAALSSPRSSAASAIPLSDTPCTVAPQCAATVSRLTCRPRIRHTIVRHATPHCMASRWRTNLNRGIGCLSLVVVEAAHLFAAGELVVDCEHKRVVGA